MSLKEIKNRNIYLTFQDWPQAPVTTSDEAPQVDEEQKADTQEDFLDCRSTPLSTTQF
jgi:hypothetical protein